MSSSLINIPSTEDVGYKNLDLRFNHRFGDAQSGFKDLFGLDSGANILIGADYGINDRISLGFSRISDNKTYELRTKVRLLTQSESFPFTISFWGVAAQDTDKQIVPLTPSIQVPSTGLSVLDAKIQRETNEYELSDNDKRSYMASFLISRKVNRFFSLQISPTFVHRNFVKSALKNDRIGINVGGRIKLSKRIDFTFEAMFTKERDYIGTDYESVDRQSKIDGYQTLSSGEINSQYSLPKDFAAVYFQNVILDKPVPHYSVPLSFGIDFETGGHVFQVFVTDTRTLAQTKLLNGGDFDFSKRQYSFGFNIHRNFSFNEDSQKKEWEKPDQETKPPSSDSEKKGGNKSDVES